MLNLKNAVEPYCVFYTVRIFIREQYRLNKERADYIKLFHIQIFYYISSIIKEAL